MKLNILMLCYYYPPLTDVGCKRSVAFSKYFKKYGWNPYVLSVKNPDKGYCSIGTDKPPDDISVEYSYSIINLSRLVGKLNGGLSRALGLINIHVKRNYVAQLLCLPDIFWGWVPLSTIKGLALIRKQKIDIIYVSCSPMSAAFCGVFLKLLTGKPLIIDFRDPFAVEVVFSLLDVPNIRRTIDRSIQKYFLRHADIFIVNNDETRKIYIQECPEVRGKIFTVHNGFESMYAAREKIAKHEKFTIIYTGEFYFYAIKSEILFEAVAILKKRGVVDGNNFQFLFYGDGKALIEQLAVKYGIEDCVAASDRIPYGTVLGMIVKSHLQLLRIIKPMISTKLFEGIPLNVPFLATIPEGEVEGIIHAYSPSSYVITEESAEQVAGAIINAMDKYKTNQILDNDIEGFLRKFSRENLSLQLMSIIERNVKLRGQS